MGKRETDRQKPTDTTDTLTRLTGVVSVSTVSGVIRARQGSCLQMYTVAVYKCKHLRGAIP